MKPNVLLLARKCNWLCLECIMYLKQPNIHGNLYLEISAGHLCRHGKTGMVVGQDAVFVDLVSSRGVTRGLLNARHGLSGATDNIHTAGHLASTFADVVSCSYVFGRFSRFFAVSRQCP